MIEFSFRGNISQKTSYTSNKPSTDRPSEALFLTPATDFTHLVYPPQNSNVFNSLDVHTALVLEADILL